MLAYSLRLAQYWCWIGGKYKSQRLAGEYVWLWAALITAVLVYVPLFLWNFGWIDIDKNSWWRIRLPGSENARERPALPSLALLA